MPKSIQEYQEYKKELEKSPKHGRFVAHFGTTMEGNVILYDELFDFIVNYYEDTPDLCDWDLLSFLDGSEPPEEGRKVFYVWEGHAYYDEELALDLVLDGEWRELTVEDFAAILADAESESPVYVNACLKR